MKYLQAATEGLQIFRRHFSDRFRVFRTILRTEFSFFGHATKRDVTNRGITQKATNVDKMQLLSTIAGGWFCGKNAGKSSLAEAPLKPHSVTPHFAAS